MLVSNAGPVVSCQTFHGCSVVNREGRGEAFSRHSNLLFTALIPPLARPYEIAQMPGGSRFVGLRGSPRLR